MILAALLPVRSPAESAGSNIAELLAYRDLYWRRCRAGQQLIRGGRRILVLEWRPTVCFVRAVPFQLMFEASVEARCRCFWLSWGDPQSPWRRVPVVFGQGRNNPNQSRIGYLGYMIR